MKKLFSILTVAVFLAISSFSAKAQNPTPEFKELLGELLELTNTHQRTEEILTMTFSSMGAEFTKPTSEVAHHLLDSIWDKYMEENAVIYSKYYTVDEIRELCAFYRTPLGQKLLECSPKTMQESMNAIQKFYPEMTAIVTQYIRH